MINKLGAKIGDIVGSLLDKVFYSNINKYVKAFALTIGIWAIAITIMIIFGLFVVSIGLIITVMETLGIPPLYLVMAGVILIFSGFIYKAVLDDIKEIEEENIEM